MERMVWAGVVAAMALVAAVYLRHLTTPKTVDLPIIGEVPVFALTNQFGARTESTNLANLVWVADVIFTQCPGQCHQLSQMMRRLQLSLPHDAPVRLVSLTANPEHDSPAVLRSYGDRYGNASDNWWLLTGKKEDIYSLAEQGLKFSVVENQSSNTPIAERFIHSASFAIVDRRGRLRAMIQAEQPNAERVILEALKRLMAEHY